ncbi:hypothetical protein M8542_18245 [Amycolatopsis sp. OK19-0408]|uniref:Membrane-associated oxidoreductase n=1 Tax=Amycolatopsis iheyensis TaxID=2945988 RepID=A0A9X2ND23_9PSEU|nr:hypothetical protein [Amycolatopsis iheyensis]MCR6484772.1 hypothetical protein [Amycolatopsis iheyensis]
MTEDEHAVVEAARLGIVLTCSTLSVEQLAEDEDPAHEVRAELLRELLIGLHGSLDPRGVRIKGARIVGALDLAHVCTKTGLELQNCFVPEPITMSDARLSWLSLAGSRLAGVAADGLRIEGDLDMSNARVVTSSDWGAVLAADAHIGGFFDLEGAEITNDSGPALMADRLEAGSDLRLENLRAAGSGARGAIRMVSARVRGQLSLIDAEVTNGTGPAVTADRLQVEGHVLLWNARIAGSGTEGAVWLLGAKISGVLDFTNNAKISNTGGVGLQLQGLHVEADALLPASLVCVASKSRGRCNHPGRINLDGFTFSALHKATWREWLHLIRFHTPAYRPGPYQQLAAVERAAGHDGNARRILIAQQRDLYRRAPKELGNWLTRRFHWLWGRLAGYGYLARRTAAALLFALALAGGLGFWAGHVVDAGHHAAERPASFDAPVGKPCTTIELVEVGLDRGLPLSPTGVRTRCDLNPAVATGGLFTVAIWLVQAAVWGLATLALAGYTGLVRKIG